MSNIVQETAPRLDQKATTPGLHITVRLGTGSGPTHLAAFDAALQAAGVADRNLLLLSSIIPPGATVERTPEAQTCPGGWGDRLYVVMAEERVERPHEEAWAGVGWRQDPESGAGLFVEHHGHSEHQVEADLLTSLQAISDGRPPRDWEPPQIAMTGVVCETDPVCALAVACFQSEPWRPEVIDLRDG
ncbi:MAG TPA: pyruvoyl-dependent arginine decarboxylase [Acidimicrobiales bacterium]|nr:pyruvoyl-dependent arginine decarboxylase [Acidimicrobiales bacterium]